MLGLDPASPPVPRFSVSYMDTSVKPDADLYHYAAGTWLKQNPVPADKSRWSAFDELQQRNWHLLHHLLDQAAADQTPRRSKFSCERKVGDLFYSPRWTIFEPASTRSASKPLQDNDFARIAALKSERPTN